MSTRKMAVVRVVAVTMLAGLLAGVAPEAFAVSAGITGRTNLSGGLGCATCHGATADTTMTVTITGASALNAGQSSTYTVTATKSGVANGTRMGLNAAAGDAGSLSVLAGEPTVLSGGEIIHSGALRTVTSNSANYKFTYTMPGGSAVGSTHTLYAVAALSFSGWKHATNFTVTTRPTAPSSLTASNATSASVNLTWSGGGPEYGVVYKTGAVAPASETDGTLVTQGTSTATTITGLSPSTQYSFAVFSRLTGGSTIYSTSGASATATTTASVVATRYVNASTGVNTGACSVPANPCKTITYAMGQATAGNPGDLVSVAPGTYNLALGEVFPIALKSGVNLVATGTPANTIIDAVGDTVKLGMLTSSSNASSSARIEGFTIANGLNTPSQGGVALGGALRIEFSSATFTVTRNLFSANEARGYTADGTLGQTGGLGWGGAIHVFSSTVEITNNVFVGNIARGGSGQNHFGTPRTGNESGGSGEGGAIYFGGSGKVTNNTFHGNSAIGGNGGGSSTGTGNGGGGSKGAVSASGNPAPSIVNNIFMGNAATAGTGGTPDTATAGAVLSGNAPSIANNLFFANTVNGAASTGDSLGTGSIALDPLFHFAPSNLRLRTSSPAKAAGTATGAPTSDFDATTRPNPPSIGAFEASTFSTPVVFSLVLQGAQQVPPVVTSATGSGTATYNPVTRQLALNLTYSGLSSAENGAHIHGPAARGVNAGVLFALAAGSPKTDTVTLTSAQETDLLAGKYYVNVHTTINGGGEIRAQIDTVVTTANLTPSPTALAFGGQSMNTTSPALAVTLSNSNSSSVTVTSATVSTYYAVSHNCASVGAGASCTANVTFTPTAQGSLTGTLTVVTSAGTLSVPLSGTGEKSLVTHYYRSILRRAPDSGGKSFWEAEATRVQALGVNVNEVWFAMAGSFYFSAEYLALNRDNAGFVTDLYGTFFNRAPDAGGFADWTAQLAAGMPREVVLASFMFSTEFATFTQAIFGTTTTRKEIDTVVDFFRGILARLPDDGGFAFWLQKFRAAQCLGGAAVNTEVESISSQFAQSAEYAARARSNSQYVGDLYNAFLRRGGDLGGVQFWISQVATGAQTREAVRKQFVASAEFSARVNAIIAQGCLP